MCDPLSFVITPAAYAKLVQEAQSAGLRVTGNSGSGVYMGCTILWVYTPGTGQLDLRCTDKPWYYPCGAVNSRLQAWVMAATK